MLIGRRADLRNGDGLTKVAALSGSAREPLLARFGARA